MKKTILAAALLIALPSLALAQAAGGGTGAGGGTAGSGGPAGTCVGPGSTSDAEMNKGPQNMGRRSGVNGLYNRAEPRRMNSVR